MSDLIVLAERDIRNLLKINRIYPSLLCTSIEAMIPRLPYIIDSHVVIMFNGLCEFGIPNVVELYKTMLKQVGGDKNIRSINVLTDVSLRDFETYYRYRGIQIRKTSKIEREKEVKKDVDIWNLLKYDKSNDCEFISDRDEKVLRDYTSLSTIQLTKEYTKMMEIISIK